MPPAALTALLHTVAVLEEFAGKAGDTLHAMAVSRESDLWDRAAVHLYNSAADLHDGQALLAAAQETLKKALTEDSGDVDSDG